MLETIQNTKKWNHNEWWNFTRIDTIPNEQQSQKNTGTTELDDTLLQRNIEHFSQAEGTPFTTQKTYRLTRLGRLHRRGSCHFRRQNTLRHPQIP
jgi:hypothetical protein